MKTKTFLIVCLAGMITACSQKQSAVSVPVSQIDVEKLLDSLRERCLQHHHLV